MYNIILAVIVCLTYDEILIDGVLNDASVSAVCDQLADLDMLVESEWGNLTTGWDDLNMTAYFDMLLAEWDDLNMTIYFDQILSELEKINITFYVDEFFTFLSNIDYDNITCYLEETISEYIEYEMLMEIIYNLPLYMTLYDQYSGITSAFSSLNGIEEAGDATLGLLVIHLIVSEVMIGAILLLMCYIIIRLRKAGNMSTMLGYNDDTLELEAKD